jgi:transcriptional regulator with XRE-family HTH domain
MLSGIALATLIKQLAKDRKVKTGEMFRAIGVNKNQLSTIREGRLPDTKTLIAIAEYLDVPLDVFQTGKEKPPQNSISGNVTNSSVTQETGNDENRHSLSAEAAGTLSPEALTVARRWSALDADGRAVVLAALVQEERLAAGPQTKESLA